VDHRDDDNGYFLGWCMRTVENVAALTLTCLRRLLYKPYRDGGGADAEVGLSSRAAPRSRV
jgi:hypothetical protein